MKQYIFSLGFFDGVHRGHQALLAECVTLARRLGLGTAAITFDNHPQAAFTSAYPILLSGLADRVALLRHCQMEYVHILQTDAATMSIPWESFLEQLIGIGAAGFVCGDDFRFGRKGQGNAALLQNFCRERGLPCVVVPEQSLEGTRISSTYIRSLLEAGDLAAAERFLGHRHRFTGEVVHGQGLGRTIGIPTANLAVPEKRVLPKSGVYACLAHIAGVSYPAVTNIGTRPTVAGSGITVEPWILDFNGDLYGKELTLEFFKFLRPERKFDSLDALKAEILHNAEETKNMIQSI